MDVQQALMEEMCIVVNERDEVQGVETKKATHLMASINKGLLHRAFSIFLFDAQGRLLLQRRSDDKITFPGYWTNTVCSHPLAVVQRGTSATTYDVEHADEMDGVAGVKRAARRKLRHELGVTQVLEEDFTYVTRIHYLAASDETWGEHEIDYILFARKDVTLVPNASEVQDTRYMTQDELRAFFGRKELKFTPWFRLIVENYIFRWWDALLAGTLAKCVDEGTVHRPAPSE